MADYGFDPFKFAERDLHLGSALDKARPRAYVLRDYREAELRHGRLAMLAALAWPVQVLLSPVLSRALREPLLLVETGGRSPSVLNGGLDQSTIPATLGLFAIGIAVVDFSLQQNNPVFKKQISQRHLPLPLVVAVGTGGCRGNGTLLHGGSLNR